MKSLRGDFQIQSPAAPPLALAIGKFDGLHLGHKNLIWGLCDAAKARALAPSILTFQPHPAEVLMERPMPRLLTDSQSLALLQKWGVMARYVQEFNLEFARLSPEDFLRQYLFKVFKPSYLLCGYDFSFGKGGAGGWALAAEVGKAYDCEVAQWPPLLFKERPLSSGWVREALREGDMNLAESLLGRPYCLWGEVVSGQKIGRELGFPTANLATRQWLPGRGVYAATAIIDGERHPAVVNIGNRPTIDKTTDDSVECHIMKGQFALYGKRIGIDLLEKIRDEKKFADRNQLIEHIHRDVEKAKEILKGRESLAKKSP